MKRISYLRDLSSEHHQSLSLARKILKDSPQETNTKQLIALTKKECHDIILPHFAKEEQSILRELENFNEHRLVEKTLEDHRLLRHLYEHLDEPGVLLEFATALKAHVRFEERELFETMQKIWNKENHN